MINSPLNILIMKNTVYYEYPDGTISSQDNGWDRQ